MKEHNYENGRNSGEECNGNGNTRKEDVIEEEGRIGRAITEHQLPERI